MILLDTLPDVPLYDVRFTLDERDYLFTFDYSSREACWYFDIALPDGTVLVRGTKIVVDVPLLRKRPSRLLPDGVLSCQAFDGNKTPPAIGELGIDRRCQLVFATREELES